MTGLKPCPFCGSEIKHYSITVQRYGVERLEIDCCMVFDIRADDVMWSFDGEPIKTGPDALEKWNRRTE